MRVQHIQRPSFKTTPSFPPREEERIGEESNSKKNTLFEIITGTQSGIPMGIPLGAVCVQGFDDSRWVQIALLFAIRYALHRRENRVIRC